MKVLPEPARRSKRFRPLPTEVVAPTRRPRIEIIHEKRVFTCSTLTVVIPESIVARLCRFAENARPLEWLGQAVGRRYIDAEGEYVVVFGIVPDIDAIATAGMVKSTPKSEFDTRTAATVLYPDGEVLAWVHTHPGYGARFSGQDFRNQRTWTEPYHLGIVVDPSDARSVMSVYRGPEGELMQLVESTWPRSGPCGPCYSSAATVQAASLGAPPLKFPEPPPVSCEARIGLSRMSMDTEVDAHDKAQPRRKSRIVDRIASINVWLALGLILIVVGIFQRLNSSLSEIQSEQRAQSVRIKSLSTDRQSASGPTVVAPAATDRSSTNDFSTVEPADSLNTDAERVAMACLNPTLPMAEPRSSVTPAVTPKP